MNKYKIIFDILKKKIGSDAARIVTYEVYCHDIPKEINIWDKLAKIYEKWGIKRFGTVCSSIFIKENFMRRAYECIVRNRNQYFL